ncbi:MAG: Npt1/Npt2 family nucleotide transporter [bacterium]
MFKRVKKGIGNYLQLDSKELIKLTALSFGYFFIIASYSILRSLKTPIFMGFVGKEWQPASRFITLFTLIPCMLLYAKLVDWFKRYQLVYLVLGAFVVTSLIFTAFFAHPVYGIQNTQTSPYRILGWAFEIFMDLYSALVISTFWGFINSVCTTEYASAHYGIMVALSRVGGICSTLGALVITNYMGLEQHVSIPILALLASLCLGGTLICIYIIIKRVPESYLRGYEATYEAEKQQERAGKKTGMLEGLKLMFAQPYVLGIFGLVFCMETISIMFDYQFNVLLSLEMNNKIGSMSTFMLAYTAMFQAVGLLFALFGTTTLIKKIGIRSCLIIMPIAVIILSWLLMTMPGLITITVVMVILRALNYSFNWPLRDILYIPTIRDIQFKSRAWIESFGKPFSKTTGSTINWLAIAQQNASVFIRVNCYFIFGLASIYAIISYFMGRKYVTTINKNEVIGNFKD